MDATPPLYNAAAAPAALALRDGPAAAVRDALLLARARTLALADAWFAAARPVPYAPERNPPLWELGHVAWFQEWWVGRNPERALGVACDPDAPRAPSLLAQADAWYDSSRVAHRSRWSLPLPDEAATRDYLAATLAATLSQLDALGPEPGDAALYFFRLVALHEQMHAEAAVYMADSLGVALEAPPPTARPAPLSHPAELALPAQTFRIGCGPRGFAFDNELQGHEVTLAAADVDARAVDWSRFLPFVEAGGYEQRHWWDDAGWAWLQGLPQRQPAALRHGAAGWQQRRAGRWSALAPGDAATHLNAHEAQAWCRWAGRRLLTEAEWECAALTLPGFAWGEAWEWTGSTFDPYPGFTPHPYRDYSQPWFGTRRVLRGASRATAPVLAHARYRNYFEPHRQDIFSGLRSGRLQDRPSVNGV